MSKIKTPITILSMLILCCLSALLTYFILLASNVISVDKPDVTVEILNESKVYDGNPLNQARYDVMDEYLDDSHRVSVTFNNSITNVGTTVISANVDILDEKNNVVTDKYDLTVKVGTFEILPKNITISLNSVEKEYDGSPLTECDYEIIEGELAQGHLLVPYYKNEIVEIGNTDAKVEAYVYDLNGSDVTNNYNIKINDNDAQLVVKKVNLKIVPQDLSFEYTGVALSKDLFKFETIGLLPQHKFVLTSQFEPSKYALANNKLISLTDAEFDIVDENEQSVKQYYNCVVVEKGTATVFPCNVVVNLDYSAEYTGKAITLDTNSIMISLKGKDKVASAKFDEEYTNVCDSQLAKVNLVIHNQAGEDVTQYYNFEYNTRLTITPKTVIVKYSKIYTYSGEAVKVDSSDKYLTVTGLISGHTKEVKDFKNEYVFVSDSTSNAEIDIIVKNGKNDVTSNYNFEYQCKVTILPYETTFEYVDNSKITYSDTYYVAKTSYIKNPSTVLLKNHSFNSITLETPIKNAGVYGDEVKYSVKIVDKDGNDITSNYKYTTKFSLTIDRKLVKVSYTDSRVYNGDYYSEISMSKLVVDTNNTPLTKHKIVSAELKDKRLIKEAKDTPYTAELVLKIVDGYGNDVTRNYDVQSSTSISITKLNVLILSSTIYINISTSEDTDVEYINYSLKLSDITISGMPSTVTVKMIKSTTVYFDSSAEYDRQTITLANARNALEFYDVDGNKCGSSISVTLEPAGNIYVILTKVSIPTT